MTRVTLVAVVDGHIKLSTGWLHMVGWWQKKIIPWGLIIVDLASSRINPKEFKSKGTWILRMIKTLSKTHCMILDHCQSFSTLQDWCITRVELPVRDIAILGLIMRWSLLGMELKMAIIGWLRTVGGHNGGWMGTLCLRGERTSVVLICGQRLLCCNDLIKKFLFYTNRNYIIF